MFKAFKYRLRRFFAGWIRREEKEKNTGTSERTKPVRKSDIPFEVIRNEVLSVLILLNRGRRERADTEHSPKPGMSDEFWQKIMRSFTRRTNLFVPEYGGPSRRILALVHKRVGKESGIYLPEIERALVDLQRKGLVIHSDGNHPTIWTLSHDEWGRLRLPANISVNARISKNRVANHDVRRELEEKVSKHDSP